MAMKFRQLATMCAAMIAVVGLGDGAKKALASTSEQTTASQNSALVLEHGAINSTDVVAGHYSHSSHESHASHVSHYSSRY